MLNLMGSMLMPMIGKTSGAGVARDNRWAADMRAGDLRRLTPGPGPMWGFFSARNFSSSFLVVQLASTSTGHIHQ